MTKATGWVLSGNTYPARDMIRGLGGSWDTASKSWKIPFGNMAEKSRRSSAIYQLEKSGIRVDRY